MVSRSTAWGAAALVAVVAASGAWAQAFGDGTHLVGVDIQPGTYRAPGGEYCTWERLSGLGGEMDNIIAIDAFATKPTVEVRATDKAFKSVNCGTWDLLVAAAPQATATPKAQLEGMLSTEQEPDEAGKGAKVACPIDRGPVTTNVLLRVFPVRIGDQVGTGFTMEIDHRQYLVTAKHILTGELPSSIEVQIDKWITVPVELVGMGRDKQDVLVFATDRKLSEVFPVDQGTEGLMIGQSVRFLGYFSRVQTSPLPGYKNRGAPLVMSGVVSGFQFNDDVGAGSSIWVDGHNNNGFSGGPVVFQPAQARSREECRWKIAGVISGYVNAPVEVKTVTGGDTAAVAISNAGLLRAVPIEIVRDIIDKNPIGFISE